MIEQKFGPRRCRDTRKPLENQCPDIAFYRCGTCSALYQVTGGCGNAPHTITCCGESVQLLQPTSAEAVAESITIDYQITGGYNDNSIRVSWKAKNPESNPVWIYLKTFTGGYLKMVAETKRSPMVFALADTDAFAYCDEDPCLECVFRCKRGFIIYVYTKQAGLVEVPLDRMTAHWQSSTK